MGKTKIIDKKGDIKTAEKSAGEVERTGSRKEGRKIDSGRVYINASYNNIILTVTNKKGDVIAWASAGSLGFSGPKKATPFAASKVVSAILEKIVKTGPLNIEIFVSGVGAGRDSAVRSLANSGFNILSIRDITPIPHNGPKPPKVRRV